MESRPSSRRESHKEEEMTFLPKLWESPRIAYRKKSHFGVGDSVDDFMVDKVLPTCFFVAWVTFL